MGKFWCKTCSTFVDESKFERLKHEKSSKHQFALKKQLRDVHLKNKIENREISQAQKELLRIDKELGIKPNFKTTFKKKPLVKSVKAKDEDDKEDTVSQWQTVTVQETDTEVKDVPVPNKRKTKESEGEKEINNWDLSKVRSLDVDNDSDDDLKPKIVFKKRKIKKS